MKILKILALLFICSLIKSGLIGAAEFSADVINKVREKTFYAKIYMKENKIRLENQGQQNYSVVRWDKNLVWLIFPKDKVYMEMISYASQAPATLLKGEIGRKFLGMETINGLETKKYEVTIKEEEKTIKAWQWISTTLNYPIKISAPDGSWSSEYKNFKLESQPESLFELPVGFQKMEVPLLTPGLNPEKR
ncbi:MAG: hypothetical protein ACUVWV_11200 [Thermodesulfobacteriota bacterium]